ncbi:BTAD domain-containing putative transcriptional regulator [Streptomyces sp. CA-111067]|uniref:AfsR/SARP family transcriptional regulator n=1 Tax=Streptomyces sp. CA-111067 TaxID=3240046 RepID=UPI003D98194D
MLGPLELWAQGRSHRLGSPQERRVLAILLMAEGRAVPVGRLIDHAWDGDPPPSAVETLHSYISRLRSRLRAASPDQLGLDSFSRTYSLRVPPDSVDLLQFRQLCRQGRQAVERGDTEYAVSLFRDAEALRRAEPLADITGLWAASVRERLREELREATETRIRLELSLGRHSQLISELNELAERTPVVEPVVADLMTALYRCGRLTESLAAYRTARRRLKDELGLEPSRDLQDLHERILRRDPGLLQPAAPARPRLAPLDNLLRDIPDFTGREEEIGLLTQELGGQDTPTALPLAVVHGMPGVGKTRLAVRVANLLRDRYPSGRLYINLRTHSGEQPLDPAAALAGLLMALGLPADKLPAGLAERAALWRELMARRKAIIVLDDAHSASQVRPLLPGTPGCSVLVTSRHHLTDLEGAWSLSLEVPSPSQASELFTRVAGRARITDSAALRRTVELCGFHPLALHLAAARLRQRAGWTIEDLADRLAQAPSLLDEIDAPAGIAAAFGCCYGELNPDDQLVFRRLALHPGPDLTVAVAATMAGTDESRVRHSLDALLDGHLIEESGRDRVRFHDLLRDFGLTAGAREDSASERDAAVGRMLDHYLTHADLADQLAHPHRPSLSVTPAGPVGGAGAPTGADANGSPAGRPANTSTDPAAGTPVRAPTSPSAPWIRTADEAKAWLDLERANLLAAARLATTRSPHHAVYFPHVLADSFLAWGVWETGAELYATSVALADGHDDAVLAQLLVETAALLWSQGAHEDALRHASRALAISRRRDLPGVQAQALFEIGRAHLIAARRKEAMQCFSQALTLHQAGGNPNGEADTLRLLGIGFTYAGRFQEAIGLFHRALEIHARTKDQLGQVKALNNIGESTATLGDYTEARAYYERSLMVLRDIGGRSQLSNLLTNLGNICRATGETDEALSYYLRALAGYRDTGDPRGESDVLVCIGIAYLETGRHMEARLHFQMGASIAERINDRFGRVQALIGTANTQFAARQFGLAMTMFKEALRTAEELGTPLAVGRALEGIGKVTEATKGAAAARSFFERAFDIYHQLGLPEAGTIRRRLDASGAAGS